MKDYINRVFVDGKYRPGGMARKDLEAVKAEFKANALKVLADAGEDHVIYCHIEYSEDGEIKCANFYNKLPLDEKIYSGLVAALPKTDYIGAVHRNDAVSNT